MGMPPDRQKSMVSIIFKLFRLAKSEWSKRHGTAKGTMDVKERVLAKKSNEPSTSSSGQRLCHSPATISNPPLFLSLYFPLK
ncbi:LOW QUALITY PROTEIN: hypothetical protein YC2023_060717 [Brassica napus]